MPGRAGKCEMELWFESKLYPIMLECERRLRSSVNKVNDDWTGNDESPDQIVSRRRKAVMNRSMSSEEAQTSRITTSSDQDVKAIEQLQHFLQQSAAHQRQLQDIRQRRREAEAEYVPDTQGPVELPLPTDAPPTSQPHQSRYEALVTLYGDCADSIVSMETNLQSRFDRSVDAMQPRFWPIIPLRF